MTTVHVGDLDLYGHLEVPDADGDIFTFKELEGWGEAPVTLQEADRSGFGSYIGGAKLPARPLIVRGHCKASEYGGYWRLKRKLEMASLFVEEEGLIVVEEPDGDLQAEVFRAGQLSAERVGPFIIEFEIPFKAADPRKYSTTLQSSGDAEPSSLSGGRGYPKAYPKEYEVTGSTGVFVARNDGNYISHPFVVFHGPLENPQLFNARTGELFSLNIELLSTETLEVDMYDQTILLNGTSPRAVKTYESSWITLEPGDNEITFTASSPTGTMTMTWRHASM